MTNSQTPDPEGVAKAVFETFERMSRLMDDQVDLDALMILREECTMAIDAKREELGENPD